MIGVETRTATVVAIAIGTGNVIATAIGIVTVESVAAGIGVTPHGIAADGEIDRETAIDVDHGRGGDVETMQQRRMVTL